MDLRKLKKLIDLVQESGIAELEITEGEEKVRISRVGHGAADDAGHARRRSPMPAAAPAALRRQRPRPPRLPDKVEGHS